MAASPSGCDAVCRGWTRRWLQQRRWVGGGFSQSTSTFLSRIWEVPPHPHGFGALCPTDKPAAEEDEGPGSHTPYKMIQTIGLSVGAAVAYIIIVLGLMFYCKKRRKAKRLKKHPEGEEPEMECLNGEASTSGGGGLHCWPITPGLEGLRDGERPGNRGLLFYPGSLLLLVLAMAGGRDPLPGEK